MIKIKIEQIDNPNNLPKGKTSIDYSELGTLTINSIKKGNYTNGTSLNKIFHDIITNPENKNETTIIEILKNTNSENLKTKINGMTWNLRQSELFKQNFKEITKGTYQKIQ